jgi:hypothetical protein
VKPATDSIGGETVETTTRRRVIPTATSSDSKPDLWETLYHLAANPHEWERHMLYIYRIEASGAMTPIAKGRQIVEMPVTHKQVQVADKEELEFALRDVSGGNYRILLKDGPQLKTATSVLINAPIRHVAEIESGRPVQPNPGMVSQPNGDSTAIVASRAFDAMNNQDRTGAEIGFRAMQTAAEVMQRFATPNSGGGDIMQQFLAVAMQRLLAPPPDPLETLTKLLAVMSQLNPQRGQDETTAQIMKAALERLLNPAPSGAPVSATAELVRSLPAIGSYFVEGVKHYAEARKNEMQMMAMQNRGAQPQPGQPNPTLLPPTNTAPAQPSGDQMEFVEKKIIEIFQHPISAYQAADDAMAFLDTLAPNGQAIHQLAAMGEDGLLQFFAGRPILKAATSNMPRLVEFIRAFLKMHAEDVAAAHGGPAPPEPPKQPLPN